LSSDLFINCTSNRDVKDRTVGMFKQKDKRNCQVDL